MKVGGDDSNMKECAVYSDFRSMLPSGMKTNEAYLNDIEEAFCFSVHV